MTFFVVSPAYGRDYKTAKEVKASWEAGKDFLHESALHTGGGTYINNADVGPGHSVQIYFKDKTKSTVVKT
jgi:hypothetical protein